MSRIGRSPIPVPANVKVALAGTAIEVEGPKGKLKFNFREEITVRVDDETKTLLVERKDDERTSRALHGLTRTLIANSWRSSSARAPTPR